MSDNNPFGDSITADDIVDTLSFFDDWEERYKYIIDLGKELPPLPEAFHTEDRKIRGCQSQVWIDTRVEDGKLQMAVDSDAFIVKGLLGVVLAAYNNKAPQDVLAFDIDGYFNQLDLLNHLSPTRGNGLRAMVARIREIATQAEAA
ncbi:SufE family protein [Parahaliea mediterranea]|uniref:SufE family protein n=1 Tax=Parahaliea mediterranea TaxID=651086 RepID=A0A939DE76_9GAMM|nr:SufE family protein [Parahaliea mediterranea]MBN7796566.1 SufE family protein [Parahaliea mediterranea]